MAFSHCFFLLVDSSYQVFQCKSHWKESKIICLRIRKIITKVHKEQTSTILIDSKVTNAIRCYLACVGQHL